MKRQRLLVVTGPLQRLEQQRKSSYKHGSEDPPLLAGLKLGLYIGLRGGKPDARVAATA
jgi:hypothetical protein